MTEYTGQIGQDVFVVEQLQAKRGGSFLDVGAGYYKHFSNSHYLEKELGWTGIAVEIEPQYAEEWKTNRPNTIYIEADATLLDYKKICEQHGFGPIMDYLSLDLEPPDVTFIALQKILESGIKFRVITFETDFYRYADSREPSRQLLSDHGYILIRPGDQDDFYILGNPEKYITF